MSESIAETLAAVRTWRRERLSHTLFVPGAAVLVLASAVGDPSYRAAEALIAWLTAWVLLAGFRLADDLVDRSVDRVQHPERVLTGIVNPGPWWAAVATLLTVGTLGCAWLSGPYAAGAVVVLAVGLAGIAVARSAPSDAAAAAVLLKYPVVIGALRGSLDIDGLFATFLVYGVMCRDEAVDRPALWPLALATCAVGSLGLGWRVMGAPGFFIAVHGAMVAIGVVAAPRLRRNNTVWVRLGCMVWVVIQLLNVDLGRP